jgi:hypothetical protein
MFGLNITPYTNGAGQIKLTNQPDDNYHMPFRKKDVHWFNKHHKSFDRQVGQGADQLKDHNVKYNTSVIAMMNNLGSFNPTQKILYITMSMKLTSNYNITSIFQRHGC